MNLHTRSICDACHDAPATIERNGCWLCPSCDGSTISFPVTSVSCADVNAAASDSPPKPSGAAAALSDAPVDFPPPDRSTVSASQPASQAAATVDLILASALDPAKGAEGGHCPGTCPPLAVAVDPGPCGFDFEAEVAILEAQWARDGIIMNATASRIFALSVIAPISSSALVKE